MVLDECEGGRGPVKEVGGLFVLSRFGEKGGESGLGMSDLSKRIERKCRI